jgi:electron transfer flavoprotein beta subunit
LAAILGWPQATFASRIEFLTNSELRVQRETDFGLESVRIQLPAVITTDLRLNEPRYASLPSILKARKKTLEVLKLDELGYTLEPRVELLELSTVSTARSCRRVASVEELLQQLRSTGKLRNGFLP